MIPSLRRLSLTLAAALALAAPALAHITPPVLLISDRDAVVGLLSGARRFFVREVRLTAPEREAIKQQTGWAPDEDFYRFYLGRNAEGRLVAATIFVTEFTIHGPVRVAVALGPDGKARGATVVEVTEETYPWVKPLLDQDLTRPARAGLEPMPQFSIIARATCVALSRSSAAPADGCPNTSSSATRPPSITAIRARAPGRVRMIPCRLTSKRV